MSLTTRSGKALNPIGIGTWGISSTIDPTQADNGYRGIVPQKGHEEAEIEALRYSIEHGQNHVDCAELYGGFYTDEVVGRSLAGLEREDLFIADKLWKTSVATGRVRPKVEQMLHKLGTEYLDLLYIHNAWPDAPWAEALPQIDELIEEGIVRHLGVSNFAVNDLKTAGSLTKHPIAASQMNYNVLYRDEVTPEFEAYCRDQQIQIVAYQPIKRREVLSNPVVQQVAQRHDTTPAAIAIAWLIHQDTLPIPKATTKAHINENLRALDVNLSADDMENLTRV